MPTVIVEVGIHVEVVVQRYEVPGQEGVVPGLWALRGSRGRGLGGGGGGGRGGGTARGGAVTLLKIPSNI